LDLRLPHRALVTRIVLEPTDHRLAADQRHGITIERVEQIATFRLCH
jgi:hypothetical protein